jgi:hypothetical protein
MVPLPEVTILHLTSAGKFPRCVYRRGISSSDFSTLLLFTRSAHIGPDVKVLEENLASANLWKLEARSPRGNRPALSLEWRLLVSALKTSLPCPPKFIFTLAYVPYSRSLVVGFPITILQSVALKYFLFHYMVLKARQPREHARRL